MSLDIVGNMSLDIVGNGVIQYFQIFHNYQTRRSESIHVSIGRTKAIHKTFSYFCAHIWNHISNNIYTNASYFSFKNLVKFYIQNNSQV